MYMVSSSRLTIAPVRRKSESIKLNSVHHLVMLGSNHEVIVIQNMNVVESLNIFILQ